MRIAACGSMMAVAYGGTMIGWFGIDGMAIDVGSN